jgi:hypothetical protein
LCRPLDQKRIVPNGRSKSQNTAALLDQIDLNQSYQPLHPYQ